MVPKQEPLTIEKIGNFLNNIKDVPFYTLLAGLGFILIFIDIPIYTITGKSQLSGYGILLIIFGYAAYINKSKTSKKRKR